MLFYIDQIKKIVVFCLINLLFLSFNVSASECGVMQLQNNRSSGVSVRKNNCKELPDIAMGTAFDLSAKGRLWLKSNPSNPMVSEFQMICQNRTVNTIQLEFSDMLSPWLSQEKLNNCTGWIDHKLSCDGKNGEKNGVYCVLAFFKSFNGKTEGIQRTTSVKMRDVKLLQQSKMDLVNLDKKQIVEAINPELKLCKKLNRITKDLTVNWVVKNAVSMKENLKLTGWQKDSVLFECVETVITTFSYPMSSEKVAFKSIF